ncbi:helix-turn-helix domain-containing protein [Parerythrobacter aestuarii]|uniref:helix-turn-helix domain-containing protein n=1 Tax=Parerythrobacter aestuarii TaxID=3020909 RepID=UPI0024DE0FCF|nr:helix-turn-helix domain-containing protein [Parerythrobacter aestuarii]
MESRFRFKFVAAPEDLAPYINTLFVFTTDEAQLDDVLPAYSAQLIAFGCGKARMQFDDDYVAESSQAFFVTPMQRAASFSMAGPVRACGVSLTAMGWAALARLPVDEFGHRKMDVVEVLGTEAAQAVADAGRSFSEGHRDAAQTCAAMAEIVRSSLTPLRPEQADFITATMEWLGTGFTPDLAVLVEKTGLSERQIQRLCRRFFGKPPTALVKRYRAIRAATMLSQPDLRESFRDEVMAAFFDQAHMIRDIRHFTGRTPRHLANGAANVTSDTLGPEGYGVVDLFGGTATN